MFEAQNLNFGRSAPVRGRWTTGPIRPWEGAKWGTELFWEPSGIHPFVHSKRSPSTPGYQALKGDTAFRGDTPVPPCVTQWTRGAVGRLQNGKHVNDEA